MNYPDRHQCGMSMAVDSGTLQHLDHWHQRD